jgi:hypothetical protein
MRSNQEDSDEDDAHNFTVEDFDRGDHPHDDQDPLDHTFYRDHVAISLSCDLVSQNMLAAMKLDKRPPASLRSRRKRMPMWYKKPYDSRLHKMFALKCSMGDLYNMDGLYEHGKFVKDPDPDVLEKMRGGGNGTK